MFKDIVKDCFSCFVFIGVPIGFDIAKAFNEVTSYMSVCGYKFSRNVKPNNIMDYDEKPKMIMSTNKPFYVDINKEIIHDILLEDEV